MRLTSATTQLSIAPRRAHPRTVSPIQAIALSFAAVIVVGTALLLLPISHQEGVEVSPLDCLFTATSATCVTGLVTVSTRDTWSTFGHVVILAMIQVGGLGYMTLATLTAMMLGLRVGLRSRLRLQESQAVLTLADAVRVARYAVVGAFAIEALGAVFLFFRLRTHHGMEAGQAAFEGIFHSVSAFCNAGFDLAPGFAGLSLPAYQSDVPMLLVMSVLIVLGGLGFAVLAQLVTYPATRRLTLHAKLVLMTSAVLIAGGMLLFAAFECRNPNTLGGIASPAVRLVNSWFMAVTPRTAGFCPIDLTQASPPTMFLLMMLMIVGASPGGTGGGVKTTTISVILLAAAALIRRRTDIEVFQRRIGGELVRLSVALVTAYLVAILIAVFIVSLSEITLSGLPTTPETVTRHTRLIFEVVSAFGTVGLSAGITPTLAPLSRVVIIIAMYLGRLGPLAFFFTFAQPRRTLPRRLPQDAVMTG